MSLERHFSLCSPISESLLGILEIVSEKEEANFSAGKTCNKSGKTSTTLRKQYIIDDRLAVLISDAKMQQAPSYREIGWEGAF